MSAQLMRLGLQVVPIEVTDNSFFDSVHHVAVNCFHKKLECPLEVRLKVRNELSSKKEVYGLLLEDNGDIDSTVQLIGLDNLWFHYWEKVVLKALSNLGFNVLVLREDTLAVTADGEVDAEAIDIRGRMVIIKSQGYYLATERLNLKVHQFISSQRARAGLGGAQQPTA